MCVHSTLHNCCTQYCTEQTWKFSLLQSNQSPLLQWCLFVGRAPQVISASSGPPKSTTQTLSQVLQPVLHSSQQSVPVAYNGPPFPAHKIIPSHGGSGPLSNTCFLGPESIMQTASQSVYPFWQSSQLWQTDRQTGRSRQSVYNNRLHLANAVMRRNNI